MRQYQINAIHFFKKIIVTFLLLFRFIFENHMKKPEISQGHRDVNIIAEYKEDIR